MPIAEFKLPIGAKRQVTIPKGCMDLLSVKEGGELLLKVVGDHATLTPIISIPLSDLPPALRKKFNARRGEKANDVPLDTFLIHDLGYRPKRRSSKTEIAVKGKSHAQRA